MKVFNDKLSYQTMQNESMNDSDHDILLYKEILLNYICLQQKLVLMMMISIYLNLSNVCLDWLVGSVSELAGRARLSCASASSLGSPPPLCDRGQGLESHCQIRSPPSCSL